MSLRVEEYPTVDSQLLYRYKGKVKQMYIADRENNNTALKLCIHVT
jgi:hypothetical protein